MATADLKVAESRHITWNATMSPSPADVQAAIDQLREFHRLGKQITAEYGKEVHRRRIAKQRGRAEPATRIMDAISSRFGLPVHVVRALRKFANVDDERGYTDDELDDLCSLCKKHGRIIGLSQVRHLLAIEDKDERARFQTRMIREKWTNSRTTAELIRMYGWRRRGGREPAIPQDVDGVLIQTLSLTTTWRRWFDLFSGRRLPSGKKQLKVKLTDLGPDLQTRLKAVDDAIQSLERGLPKRDERPEGKLQAAISNRSSRPKQRGKPA